jgi:hypothetical protein
MSLQSNIGGSGGSWAMSPPLATVNNTGESNVIKINRNNVRVEALMMFDLMQQHPTRPAVIDDSGRSSGRVRTHSHFQHFTLTRDFFENYLFCLFFFVLFVLVVATFHAK